MDDAKMERVTKVEIVLWFNGLHPFCSDVGTILTCSEAEYHLHEFEIHMDR